MVLPLWSGPRRHQAHVFPDFNLSVTFRRRGSKDREKVGQCAKIEALRFARDGATVESRRRRVPSERRRRPSSTCSAATPIDLLWLRRLRPAALKT